MEKKLQVAGVVYIYIYMPTYPFITNNNPRKPALGSLDFCASMTLQKNP